VFGYNEVFEKMRSERQFCIFHMIVFQHRCLFTWGQKRECPGRLGGEFSSDPPGLIGTHTMFLKDAISSFGLPFGTGQRWRVSTSHCMSCGVPVAAAIAAVFHPMESLNRGIRITLRCLLLVVVILVDDEVFAASVQSDR